MPQVRLELPMKQGLQAAYDALETRDSSTLYITTDTHRIYLGDIPLSDEVKVANPITATSFDEDSQTFTFTHLDGTTTTVDLVLESVIQDVSYDSASHTLTITTVSGAESSISLTDLIDVYQGDETSTAKTSVSDGKIGVNVKISANTENAIEVSEDGLFVPKMKLSVVDSDTISMTYAEDGISGSVKISATANNMTSANSDGIYTQVPKAVIGTF